MKNKKPILYVVVPCYNEEAVLPVTCEKLCEKLSAMITADKIDSASRIMFVDDGSKDKTWELIFEYHNNKDYVTGIKLAHNKGHQNALLCGLMNAKQYADCVASMDADLQDDIDVLDGFIEHYNQGCDVVYGVRNNRQKDSFFKRTTAKGFYRFMNMLGVNTISNHADCRLLSKKALDGLSQYTETNLFLRGIVTDMGFKSAVVYYQRDKRVAGQSKYPLKKMLSFAVDGITSFSVKPLKIISNLGITISLLSVLGLLYALISKLCGVAESGWTAIVASIWLIGGIQLFCIGIVGTYIGKIFGEVKQRPRYIEDEILLK